MEAVDGVDRVEGAGRDALRLPGLRHVEPRGFDARRRSGGRAGSALAAARERRHELREAPARDARPEALEGRFRGAAAAAAHLEHLGARRGQDARERLGPERVVDRVEDVRVREVADPERQPHRREEDLLARLLAAEERGALVGEEGDDLGSDGRVRLDGRELGGERRDRFRSRPG